MLNICSVFIKYGKPLLVLCWLILFSCFVVQISAEQEIWLIDTHSAPWNCATEAGFAKAIYYQWDGKRWVRSDAETFFATQSPDVPLVLFSPGYTSTVSDTVEVGMKLVRLYNTEQHYRTVFWSWPADKTRLRLRPDIQDKILVAEASGDYLAMFLQRLKPESHVCMIGFSFGNRIICDAVIRLGDAYPLGKRPIGMRIHLVLTASATDQGWMATGSRHGEVPRLAEKILILFNPADRALRLYPLLYGNGSRPSALGRFGPPLTRITPDYHSHINAVNVNSYIGGFHRTVYFLQTPVFARNMNHYLFFGTEVE